MSAGWRRQENEQVKKKENGGEKGDSVGGKRDEE